MRYLPVFSLSLMLLSSLPSGAQEEKPCDSEEKLGVYITNLSGTVSTAFNQTQKNNSTAAADLKTELATGANGDGLTSNRLDLFKKAFLAFNLGKIDEKNGDLVFNFNPDTLNFDGGGQFSPRVTVHRTELFKPLEQSIDTLPESERQSRKDTLTKGIGELDDVEANIRWTQTSSVHTALQEVASEIFDETITKNKTLFDGLKSKVRGATSQLHDKLDIPVKTVCENSDDKKVVEQLVADIQTLGTQGLKDLKTALDNTLFFKLANLIDGQPKFSANGSFRRRSNAAGPNERSFELRFEMGTTSYWDLQRFAAGQKIDSDMVKRYFGEKNKSDSAPSFSANVTYTKTSDFKILLPVDETLFHQAESSKLSATATGGLYFGGGRSHRLELQANYDDISDDPTRQNRFVSNLSWIEKLNPTLAQALGGSDLTVTLVYANKPEFRGEVNHDLGLRAGLKWSIGGTTTK